MTNEEKAREIAGLCAGCFDERKNLNCQFDCANKGKYIGSLEMADWKDQQFRKQCVDEGFLYEWYIKSVFPKDAAPIWTEEHIEELLKDFYVIPKNIGE